AITISPDNFVAFLPAHVVLLMALILSSEPKLRLVMVGLAALTSMMISSVLGGSLIAAAAFAIVNTGELLIAALLIERFRRPSDTKTALAAAKDPKLEWRPQFYADRDCLTGLASMALLIELI